ncbi:MAG: FMN-binding glutamate synthase family protein [Acidobacteriota bacterium]|nr:FMN-binding glutamate synthase family protein [Acidobacteriota bacterium]
MVRRWFYAISAILLALIAGVALVWPPILWSLVVVAPLVALGLHDALQRRHTVLRNFPIIGHVRYMFEGVRPEIQQYFVESNIDGRPIEREMRSIVYQRAKKQLETLPFGTQRDVYEIGYEWGSHSLAPVETLDEPPRVTVGGPDCAAPYSSSLLVVSAMSFGSLSGPAILALNAGARGGGFAHNTGEGGISPYHLEPGGDLVFQLGTGYFGCRAKDGGFDAGKFRELTASDAVKMIELKLSQGAKPGHGGVLPGKKVTLEIAGIRGVPAGETVLSPPFHREFTTPRGLVEFVARLRELAGGKPVGFKLCVGRRSDFFAVCKAMLQTGITPDFIAVDGGEGGTGAAPLEFSNSLGMPARDAIVFVHNALVGAGLRERIRLIASGKIITGFHMIRAMALGADICATARGMMFALGCIQALRCNNNTCPTGITTHDPGLVHGLDVADKSERVAAFHAATVRGFLELLAAMGLRHPREIRPHHIYRRVDDLRIRHFGELYELLQPGALVAGGDVSESLREAWDAADADGWTQQPESGRGGAVAAG